MSDHLPGCFMAEPFNATTNPQVCICDRLRAAEQRVAKNVGRESFNLGEKAGRVWGVKAARDAVEKQAAEFLADDDRVGHSVMQHALAAIDALRAPAVAAELTREGQEQA